MTLHNKRFVSEIIKQHLEFTANRIMEDTFYPEKDVKEAVQQLTISISTGNALGILSDSAAQDIHQIIKNIFGEGLIK